MEKESECGHEMDTKTRPETCKRNAGRKALRLSKKISRDWRCLEKIMSNFNSKTGINFKLNTIRAVRDRYQLLETKFKRNMQKELNSSGIAVEPTEAMADDRVEYFENQESTAEIEKEAKLENIEN